MTKPSIAVLGIDQWFQAIEHSHSYLRAYFQIKNLLHLHDMMMHF